jgi:predicted TIM-barrel fold metal-dependent hydrolase
MVGSISIVRTTSLPLSIITLTALNCYSIKIIKNKIMVKLRILFLITFVVSFIQSVNAQKADLKLVDWRPVSRLFVKETEVIKPRFPVIDIHNHLRNTDDAVKHLEEMDKAGVIQCVSLDGSSKGDFYKKHLEASQKVSKERFIIFFHPDFEQIDIPDFGRKEAEKLEQAVKMGCRGLKIYKELGLRHADKSGKLIRVDDPRLDPIWAKCGELGIPVLIHVSDPVAFFTPTDQYNERYDELADHPDWNFSDARKYPGKEELLTQRNNLLSRHPGTVFIGAHVANLPEDLGRVGMWLDMYPNFYVDISARISDIGRQPYTARKFLIKYQDRVLFGTDSGPRAEVYRTYYRFLETDDEYFDPNREGGIQGRWMIYGVNLPDEVLEKIYNRNAMKIFNFYKSN